MKLTILIGIVFVWCIPANEKAAHLRIHNIFRCMHGLPLFTWNSDLEKHAVRWSRIQRKAGDIYHSCSKGMGENLAAAYGGATGACQGWYDEIKFCRDTHCSRSNAKGVVGHLTQLLWKNSIELGCSVAKGGKHRTYTTCNYWPPGNSLDYRREVNISVVKTKSQCARELPRHLDTSKSSGKHFEWADGCTIFNKIDPGLLLFLLILVMAAGIGVCCWCCCKKKVKTKSKIKMPTGKTGSDANAKTTDKVSVSKKKKVDADAGTESDPLSPTVKSKEMQSLRQLQKISAETPKAPAETSPSSPINQDTLAKAPAKANAAPPFRQNQKNDPPGSPKALPVQANGAPNQFQQKLPTETPAKAPAKAISAPPFRRNQQNAPPGSPEASANTNAAPFQQKSQAPTPRRTRGTKRKNKNIAPVPKRGRKTMK